MTSSQSNSHVKILRSSGLAALLVTAAAPLAFVSLATATTACGSKPADAPTASATASAVYVDPNAGTTAGIAASGVAPVPTTSGYPTVAPTTTTAPTAPTATAADASSPTQTALDLIIQAAATKDAPKMDKEGAPIFGTLTEGGHADGLVTLSPGRCYTIIAAGQLNTVTKVDVTLLMPPLYNVNAGQASGTTNAVSEIGKGSKALCPVLMFPVAYKVDVLARTGSGDVRAQLFSRAK